MLSVSRSDFSIAPMPSQPQDLKSAVGSLPATPGVYLFYGPQEELLYVGKSKNIRTRVRSHFRDRSERLMMRRVRRVETLQRLVEEKTAELRDTDQLTAAGRISVMVAHDLRSPIQVIRKSLVLEPGLLALRRPGNFVLKWLRRNAENIRSQGEPNSFSRRLWAPSCRREGSSPCHLSGRT